MNDGATVKFTNLGPITNVTASPIPPVTDTFTIQRSGIYEFSWFVQSVAVTPEGPDPTIPPSFELQANGSSIASSRRTGLGSGASNREFFLIAHGHVHLNQGDQITLNNRTGAIVSIFDNSVPNAEIDLDLIEPD